MRSPLPRRSSSTSGNAPPRSTATTLSSTDATLAATCPSRTRSRRNFGGVFTDYTIGTLGGGYVRNSAALAATANAGSYTDLVGDQRRGRDHESRRLHDPGRRFTVTLTVTRRPLTSTPVAGYAPLRRSATPGFAAVTADTGAGIGLVNGDTVLRVSTGTLANAASNVGTYGDAKGSMQCSRPAGRATTPSPTEGMPRVFGSNGDR